MILNPNSAAQHDSAIQSLIERTELPRDTVAELYRAELEAIQPEVRITQFLSLIVTRRVVHSLRERGLGH
ncbi:MAG: DUF3562 domain-containing protein [Steroidobacteraceae bacterium]